MDVHLGSTKYKGSEGAGTTEPDVWHSFALSSILLLSQAEVVGALCDCLLTSWIDGKDVNRSYLSQCKC